MFFCFLAEQTVEFSIPIILTGVFLKSKFFKMEPSESIDRESIFVISNHSSRVSPAIADGIALGRDDIVIQF